MTTVAIAPGQKAAVPVDFREYLARIEAMGLVRRVTASVDRAGEIPAIVRTVQMEVPERQRYGLVFENVRDATFPAAIGVTGFSRSQIEAWIGMPYRDRLEAWVQAFDHPLPTRRVAAGPCQQNQWRGSQVDLTRIPFPWWSPDQDGGPYHTNGIIVTRDPATGAQNAGIYRMMLIDERTATITINPNRGAQHGGMMLAKYMERGERMPVAVAIGCHPLVHMLGGGAFPYGLDEVTVAGAMMGRPVEVVRCVTSDLEVPADAEIVLEGWMDGIEKHREGPWGESAGYQEVDAPPANVFHVEAITFRDHAIYTCTQANQMPAEAGYVTCTMGEAQLYRFLKYQHGFGGVTDIAETHGASTITVIVQTRRTYPGAVKQILTAVAGYSPAAFKNIIVVDDDIDPHDPLQVEWAIAYRVQPHRDLTIIEDLPRVHQDVSTAPEWRRALTSKLLVDATKKWAYPPATRINPQIVSAARARWAEFGLPPLD